MGKISLVFVYGVIFTLLGCSKSVESDNGGNDADPDPDPIGKIFRAGAAIKSITPSQDDIEGIRNVVQYDHDSCYVRTLLLDDGESKLLFVVLDLISYEDYLSDVTKRKINERTGIPVKNIMISVTHTHFGPVITGSGRFAPLDISVWTDWELDPYQSFVAEQAAASAEEALGNLEVAVIGWGKAEVPQWVHNRRFKMKSKIHVNPWGETERVRTNPANQDPDIVEPLGPVDPEVSFISAKAIDGGPIALFASFAPHYPADIPAPYLSADYYGVFAQQIKEFVVAESGDKGTKPFVGSLAIGTGGNQAALDRREPIQGTILERRKQMGFDVARAVYMAMNDLQYKSWVKLDVEQSILKLDARKLTDATRVAQAEMLLERYRQGLPFLNHRLEASYATGVLRMRKIWPDQVDITLQAFRIGDLAVVAIPGEVFVETGLSIKQKSPFSQTYTNGLSNGSYGYFPTDEQHLLGGYETWIGLANRVEISTATKVETEVLSVLGTLKERE